MTIEPHGAETDSDAISVVLISKDESNLAVTLERLRPECLSVKAECLVVDASLGRMASTKAREPWVRWIDFAPVPGRRFTIPHQRNAGVRAATGSIIVFCDCGTDFEPGWLGRLVAPILARSAVATAGPIASRDGRTRVLNNLPDGAVVDHTITANFAFRSIVFDLVGGFDERYDYYSDSDFGWRLADRGQRTIMVSSAVVIADHGDRRRAYKRNWRYGHGLARQMRFHPSRRRWLVRTALLPQVTPALAGLLVVASLASLVFGATKGATIIGLSALGLAGLTWPTSWSIREPIGKTIFLAAFLDEWLHVRWTKAGRAMGGPLP